LQERVRVGNDNPNLLSQDEPISPETVAAKRVATLKKNVDFMMD
jgi:hypothetical protein